MKQIKKSNLNLIIAVIALLLTAAAISAAIVYVNRTPEVYPSDREAVYEAKQTRAKEKCFAAYAPAQVINDKSEYTTPYGTFELIESVIDINEYLTLNPTVPDPELCRLYITESGDNETAAEIMMQIKAISDSVCDGCTDDYSKAYALAMWTGQNIAYDHDAAHNSADLSIISLEAILNNGMKTTCSGFANFYSALCHSQGIYCLYLKGGSSSEGYSRAQLAEAPANHTWNAVALDGQWYYVDCTWISDLGVENGIVSGGENIKPFYALFGFGEMSIERQARYDSAIREAEGNIMAGKEVINREINGKSLIMQLFREHEIPVPLKTQGWIINSLHSIRYDPQIGEWNYRYFKGSRNSTKMFDLLSKLSAAIQTRQQFEEHGASPPDTPVLDCEEEQDMEL